MPTDLGATMAGLSRVRGQRGTLANGIDAMRLTPQWLQMAALFDFVEDAVVWIKDGDGRYQWVNRAFLMNLSLDERFSREKTVNADVLGKTDYDLSATFLADQFRLDDEYVLTGRRIVDRIELVGQPGGEPVWSVTNKIPLFGDDGEVVGTAGITRRLETAGPPVAAGSGFGPVLAYMRDHYHLPITNRQLARLAHLSVRAFERKFQHTFHVTPQRYLRKLQLRMACRALVYTRRTLAEVASSCGFSDQSHFTRAFRQQFGRTPKQYRAHYGRGEGDAASVPNLDALGQESAAPARL